MVVVYYNVSVAMGKVAINCSQHCLFYYLKNLLHFHKGTLITLVLFADPDHLICMVHSIALKC